MQGLARPLFRSSPQARLETEPDGCSKPMKPDYDQIIASHPPDRRDLFVATARRLGIAQQTSKRISGSAGRLPLYSTNRNRPNVPCRSSLAVKDVDQASTNE